MNTKHEWTEKVSHKTIKNFEISHIVCLVLHNSEQQKVQNIL